MNAASLFQLSAIIEKRNLSGKKLTSVAMPDAGGKALIEGTETMVFYTAWILFPEHIDFLFGLFGILVVTTILQRAAWAIQHL